MKSIGVLLLHFLLMPHIISCWNDDAVLLRDVQVLTLHRGRYTTARRSSPVAQLQCIGGSAGCGSFVLEVVQCYNRGWDGIDVQWECKADMENWYRFGRVEVSCEGYTSPNDAYVLKGSCGLEYTLELTAEGKQQQGRDSQGSSGFSGFASNFFQGFSDHKHHQSGGQNQQSDGDGVGGLIVVGFFLLLAYGVYKMFLCSPTQGRQGFHANGSQDFGGAWDNSNGAGPPPPGFKPDCYTDQTSSGPSPGPGPGYGFSDEYTRPQTDSWTGFTGGRRSGGGGGGGGFWPGMGAGSVLGYLFGNQRRQPHMGPSYTTGPSYTSRPSPAPKTSSGTRTASGFGGTKKR